MAKLSDLVKFCDERSRRREVKDFSGALNGLQIENNGEVAKIGAAVDAGLRPFQAAVDAGIDLLIVHHGMFWNGSRRYVGSEYEKLKTLIEGNLAVYSCHLPLDAHEEIGNSALLAKAVGISRSGSFLPYEGVDIGFVGDWSESRQELRTRLESEFQGQMAAMEFGSASPKKICVVTGSGVSAVDQIKSSGADTLITGELKQHYYNIAQEEGLNLYACGHYATETYGVKALAQEAAANFGIEYEFIKTDCPL